MRTIVPFVPVGKGEETRFAVFDQAVDVARRVGLSGLTIGRLAEQTAVQERAVRSLPVPREAVQLQALEHARTRFEEAVARPALTTTRGEPRIRARFEHWIAWDARPGGRPFAAASTEFDDQPGRCGTASSATTGTYWTSSLY